MPAVEPITEPSSDSVPVPSVWNTAVTAPPVVIRPSPRPALPAKASTPPDDTVNCESSVPDTPPPEFSVRLLTVWEPQADCSVEKP